MICSFCHVDVRGSRGCQTQSQANKCANNRGRETDDWGDHITRDFCACQMPQAAYDAPVIEIHLSKPCSE